MLMKRRALLTLPLFTLPGLAVAEPSSTEPSLAERLRRGGVVVLLRHATTDAGIGDPPDFKLGECGTQRNLSAEGRAQAQGIGAWFRAQGLRPARVRSSAWCRCLDTGTLAFGRAEVWVALNSLFSDDRAREQQNAALRQALGAVGRGQFEVWVTHQVNITALTGQPVAMGEGWVTGADLKTFGSLRFER